MLCCSLKLVSADGYGGNGVALLSDPYWGVCVCHSSGTPLRKAVTPLVFQLLSDPCLHPVSLRWHSTPYVLSQAWGWVSKLPILWTHADPLGEGLAMLWPVPVCPSKAVPQLHSGSELMVKCSKKHHQGLLPSASVCIPMLVNRDAHWCCQFFCPQRGHPPFPNAFQKRELFFPV